jgi:hypothetical protein
MGELGKDWYCIRPLGVASLESSPFSPPVSASCVCLRMSSNSVPYEYLSLAQLPIVNFVVPSSGPTQGGTLVTVSGSGFQSRGTVTFEVAVGSATAVLGECRWNIEDGSTNYTNNAIR